MNWINLCSEEELTALKELSKTRTQLIFKHSTRCSVSSIAKSRLERNDQPDDIDFHFLDLLQFRSLSDKIASDFGVYHESPQVLLIKDTECIYDESHNGIRMDDIIEQLN
jgi:bacillithiol system protein YtxJ